MACANFKSVKAGAALVALFGLGGSVALPETHSAARDSASIAEQIAAAQQALGGSPRATVLQDQVAALAPANPDIGNGKNPAPPSPASANDLASKWQQTIEKINLQLPLILQCRSDVALCSSPAARKIAAIADSAAAESGLARLGIVNSAVNLSVKYVSDINQYGALDYWASPFETMSSGAGDCEDYAILKYAVLRAMGTGKDELKLLVVRDRRSRQTHAVLAVRFGDKWRLLDNRTMAMADAAEAHHYLPLAALQERTGEGAVALSSPATQDSVDPGS